MRAGDLDRRVTLLQASVIRDAANTPQRTWTTLAERACSKHDVSDGERLRAEQLGATITTRFRVRWDPTIAELNPVDHRLRFEGRTYEVTAVKEIGRREGLEISATALAKAAA